MKKTLFLAISLLCAMSVSAQDLKQNIFRVHTGVTIANLSTSESNVSESTDFKAGFQIGASYERLLLKTNPLYFETGLYVTQKGGKQKNELFSLNITQWQILVPAMLNYKIGVGKGVAIIPFAGLYYSCGVGGKMNVTMHGLDGLIEETYVGGDTYGSDSNIARSELGMRLGAGVSFKNIVLKVGYELGFTNLLKDSEDIRMNSSSFTVTLGYTF